LKVPDPSSSSIKKDYKRESSKANSANQEGTQVNSVFSEILESILPSQNEKTRDLHQLWEELPQLERKLIETKGEIELNQYKNHVRNIFKLALDKNTKVITHNYKVKKPEGTYTKTLYTVKHLDDKLKLLTETILNPSNTAFHIMKQLDDIRGLLVKVES
jgi:hypothetical protein